MIWKTIPSFPLYEINVLGEVRNVETKQLKKLNKLDKRYTLYSKGTSKPNTRTISSLLKEVFEADTINKKNTNKPLAIKQCANCEWQYDNKCSVRFPGNVYSAQDDDSCHKWEPIKKQIATNYNDNFDYENDVTAQFVGVDTAWEGYALSV